MKKILAFLSCLSALAVLFAVQSCKKDETTLPLEPITIVQPDSAIVRQFPGDTMAIQLQFTTDRPINWIMGLTDIDTTHAGGYTATYPDTLFLVHLDTLNPRVNLYTYNGVYSVPNSLNPYDIVRFKVSFEAGKSTFTTGQNYPAGIVTSSKEFRIDVR